MEEVISFLRRFIDIEKKIEVCLRKRDLENHNLLVDEINNMCGEGVVLANKEQEPLSRMVELNIKENANRHVNDRYLHKISSYDNLKYGRIWACYLSVENPAYNLNGIDKCFVVAMIGNELKVVAYLGVNLRTNQWRFYAGDNDQSLQPDQFQDPIEVKRILEPSDDEWSMEEYLLER